MTRRLSVLLLPAEIDAVTTDDRVLAVLVDVLRSTSVIPAALAAGAAALIPAAGVEAWARRDAIPGALLGGERDGRLPEGFDLGNSPSEYTPDRVGGRVVVFSSSNGVPALLRLRGAHRVLTAAFVNEGAVGEALLGGSEDVVLVAAGKDRRPALEDVALCGSLTARLLAAASTFVPDDGAEMALAIWNRWMHDVRGLLATSAHGAWLVAQGWSADLEFCAQRDLFGIVPVLESNRIVPLRTT
jgi:2-phosphosulfolactate phosphatase